MSVRMLPVYDCRELAAATRSAAVACGDASLKMDFDGTEAAAPGVSVSGVAACVEYQDHPE